MQFNFVAVTLAALVASAAAQNATNGTNGTIPSLPKAPESGAFSNAVSGGLLGAAIAGGLALVCCLSLRYNCTSLLTSRL
ncbi:hypothetical protein BZA77DRAFT_304216 [Pyronema omphalodes]|nr:hypothetical protein BZA77DRAFT_304216 [Pyronema omphalodes]